MSRIDQPRSTGAVSPLGGGRRVVPGSRLADGSIATMPLSAPPPRRDTEFDTRLLPRQESTAVLSPSTVRAQDLQPLAGLETDRLIAELSRIELVLSDMLAREGNADSRQSLEIGQGAIADHTRRLNVLSAGYSALVTKW